MGYYAQGEGYNQRGADYPMMTPANQEQAFQAVHERLLPERVVKEKALGGSYFAGKQQSWYYSWCNMEYLREVAETFTDILEHLGFHVEKDDSGNIISMWYDSKVGQEDLFLEATREYWEPGAVIDWTGEDTSLWRSDLSTGLEKTGRVVYD